MRDKPNSLFALGIECDGTIYRAAEVTLLKGTACPQKVYEFPKEAGVKPLYMEQNPDANDAIIITPLFTSETLVRQLTLPLKKEGDVDAVLNFQAEPLLPYPVETAIIDRIFLDKTTEGITVSLFAARKDHVETHIKFWTDQGLSPEVVSCVPSALGSFLGLYPNSENYRLIIHFGRKETSAALVKNGKLIAAQSSGVGVDQLLEAMEEDGDISITDFSVTNEGSHPQLRKVLDKLKNDTTRLYLSLSKQAKEEIDDVWITGEGCLFKQLPEIVCEGIQKPLQTPELISNSPLTVEEIQRFAVPIGLAISGLPKYDNQINFRQDELAYPNPWKRWKKPLATYLGLCAALTVATLIFTNSYAKSRVDEIRGQYSELLQIMNKPYSKFESKFEEPPKPIQHLNEEDLSTRLETLSEEIRSTPGIFPLVPNTPRVSDVFAWLMTHPIFTQKDSAGNTNNPYMQVDNFSYTMVKRPEQNKKQEKYMVKVEMEFSSPSPKLAREFHDSLISPNDFVDPKEEVKWSANQGKYRTSFYLKDKTFYPALSKENG